MGLISKIFMIIVIIFAGYWAYNNVNITTITICVTDQREQTSITCVTSRDCAKYLTSLYGEYPDTAMYRHILSQTAICSLGQCELNEFEIKDKCVPGEERAIRYKATLKDIISTK